MVKSKLPPHGTSLEAVELHPLKEAIFFFYEKFVFFDSSFFKIKIADILNFQ